MNKILCFAVLVGLATPVAAQSAIKGIELSPTDAARVDRQCDALQFRTPASLGSSTPEEPEPGEIVADASGYWATTADGMDAALAKINLDTLSIRDCREAGFYN
ncbi:MAG: hypothetical protein JWQ89_640 [Devosia sp.]|uniref:hypothetical protein n=1 Tax=Devosia sp. TaxID=1871048 RepID=UPI00260AC844|nr:hypothetical protein [Devosia sp.]MDB5538913.1 hypothetical protein [Devosia sp.]